MPMFTRDFTDFSSSINHAYNYGNMFRGPENRLVTNFVHMPIAYHSRASSIVLDGTPIRRPRGQVSKDGKNPEWDVSRSMDFELEIGTIVGKGNQMGMPIRIENARDHIFGFCLLNDWSTRDILKWEIAPLGPFCAKNFASTVSPWVITPEALAPFKTPLAIEKQDPPVL